MNYDKMVFISQEMSKSKIKTAREAMIAMEENKEKITVAALVKRTGLSRGFFYKNKAVRTDMDQAKYRQTQMSGSLKTGLSGTKSRGDFHAAGVEIYKIQEQNEKLEEENKKLKEQKEHLSQEIEQLQKKLKRKEIAVLKKL